MSNVSVNITLQDSLLAEIDATARKELRSRSELLREAARLYVRRQQQWNTVFALGDRVVSRNDVSEADIEKEIRAVRRTRRTVP